MEERKVVVFDFDGTLVSKDTGYQFNRWLIKKSIFRRFLTIAFLPIIATLITNSISRRFGLNIWNYIATGFQNESLFRLRKNFMHFYFTRSGSVAYAEGLNELRQHQQNGKSILIISGCPHWLLHGAVKHLGLRNINIIGSKCKVSNFALLLEKHCYKSNKLRMSKESGYEYSNWLTGYSDSRADIPMLSKCANKVLINVKPEKVSQFKRKLSGPIEIRSWT